MQTLGSWQLVRISSRPCENAFGSEVNVFRRLDNAMQARRSVEASFATTGPVARTDTHSGSV
jgi:hypothetical protein